MAGARNWRRAYAILRGQPLDPEEVILGLSRGRTTHLSALNDEEWQALMRLGQTSTTDEQRVADADRWRKRVMAAIGGWLRLQGKPQGAVYIIGIAERSAGGTPFNAIRVSKLRAIYYEFVGMARTIEKTRQVASEIQDKKQDDRITR